MKRKVFIYLLIYLDSAESEMEVETTESTNETGK